MRKTRTVFLIATVLLFALAINGCTGMLGQSTPTPTGEPTLDLQDNIVSALGEVVPEKWANLAFASGGSKLDILVTPGQSVLTNKILAQVDDIAQQVVLASAESALASAKANQERLEDLDADESDIAVAIKAVEAAQAGLKQAQQSLDAAVLKAPFDGVIVDVFLQDYETASPGQPVVLLADLKKLLIETTDLGEVDVARVQIGDPVKVVFDALPDVTATGKVIRIALRPESGAGVYYTVTIQLDKVPESLRWGMSAFVEIEVSK